MLEQLHNILDIPFIVNTFGYPGLFAIVFAETGLLFGFFLPGDSLMITAGILAAKGLLNIFILVPLLFSAAVIGDSVGYTIGHKLGRKLFKREDSLLFHKDHLLKAKAFYDKHGGKTIIIARFMPLIRTFAPVVAGMAEMPYSLFLLYNIVGALLWAVGLTLLGFFVGNLIPEQYFEPLIFLVIFLSISPALYHALKTKEQRQKMIAFVTSLLKKKK